MENTKKEKSKQDITKILTSAPETKLETIKPTVKFFEDQSPRITFENNRHEGRFVEKHIKRIN